MSIAADLVSTTSYYRVIFCDPPWPYDNPRDGKPRLGGYTYPSMSMEELVELPVARIAERDCALFLCATFPKLPEALRVMTAWGFKYTTCAFVWVKLNPKGSLETTYDGFKLERGVYSGLGSWTNQNAEIVLLGKRGKPRRVLRNVKQIIFAPRGRHSAKPHEIRTRIESLMGDVTRIELFARERVPGWDAMGNEL